MKPWKLVAKPHADVLNGRMRQSDFAADLAKVAAGTSAPEYSDPEKFFARTYLTKGLAELLRGVAQRLAGTGVLDSAGGKVRLLRYEEYPERYDPAEAATPRQETLGI